MSRRKRSSGLGEGRWDERGEQRGESVLGFWGGAVGEGLRAGTVGDGVDRGDATASRAPTPRCYNSSSL